MSDEISKQQIEEGSALMPAFGRSPDGLIAAIARHAESGAVLMLAWMNEAALAKTLETGEVWYFSRSRNALWHKGATSGQVQRLIAAYMDCDQDAILLDVLPGGDGGACHTGRTSCFYRRIVPDGAGGWQLEMEGSAA